MSLKRPSGTSSPPIPRRAPGRKHKWSHLPYGGGGAQILVHDLDGDGDMDLVSSYNAHGTASGGSSNTSRASSRSTTSWARARRRIPSVLPSRRCTPSPSPTWTATDAWTSSPGNATTPTKARTRRIAGAGPLLVPQHLDAEKKIEFVPHFIHDDSGVGVEVKVADLNGDSRPDVVSSSKKGLTIHVQKDATALSATALERWQVPGGRPQDGYGSGLSRRMPSPAWRCRGFLGRSPRRRAAGHPAHRDELRLARTPLGDRGSHLSGARPGNYNEGKDRILIFEDGDGDGTFETRKIFAEKLNLASGIAIGFGGVYVGAAPYFLFYLTKTKTTCPTASRRSFSTDGVTRTPTRRSTPSPGVPMAGSTAVTVSSPTRRWANPALPRKSARRSTRGVWRFIR